VADTGSGIRSEDHAHVFEPFRQSASDTLPDGPKGTGLGLPISKQIVEAHRGRMWLASELGVGSTFSFAVPVASAS
jgi:signal transduction histidine kinase